jgi:hypothetical protein
MVSGRMSARVRNLSSAGSQRRKASAGRHDLSMPSPKVRTREESWVVACACSSRPVSSAGSPQAIGSPAESRSLARASRAHRLATPKGKSCRLSGCRTFLVGRADLFLEVGCGLSPRISTNVPQRGVGPAARTWFSCEVSSAPVRREVALSREIAAGRAARRSQLEEPRICPST